MKATGSHTAIHTHLHGVEVCAVDKVPALVHLLGHFRAAPRNAACHEKALHHAKSVAQVAQFLELFHMVKKRRVDLLKIGGGDVERHHPGQSSLRVSPTHIDVQDRALIHDRENLLGLPRDSLRPKVPVADDARGNDTLVAAVALRAQILRREERSAVR